MRMYNPWTSGSIQHGGRQEIGILGIKSSVRWRSARSSPPRRRSTCRVISRMGSDTLYGLTLGLHKIWGRISRKRLEIEEQFQWTTNRKWQYGESNGQETDDLTRPWEVNVGTPICLKTDILKTVAYIILVNSNDLYTGVTGSCDVRINHVWVSACRFSVCVLLVVFTV